MTDFMLPLQNEDKYLKQSCVIVLLNDFFLFQNNRQNLDPYCKVDLTIWGGLGEEILQS